MIDFGAWLSEIVAQYGYFGVLIAAFIGNATVFFPVPIYLMVYVLAPSMDPWLLGVIAGLGAALGELVGYVVGYGIEWKAKIDESRFSSQYMFAKAALEKWGFLAIIIFAATPLPHDAIGIACGLVGYSVAKFFVATLIGKIIKHLVIAWSGFYSFALIKEIFGGFGEAVSIAFFLLGIAALILAGKVFSWERLARIVVGETYKKKSGKQTSRKRI